MILIVEDDIEIQSILTKYLKLKEYFYYISLQC